MGRGGQLGFIKEKSRTSLFWPWQLLNQIGKSTCTCVNYKHRNQSMAGLLLSEPGPPLALPTDPKTGLWMHTLSWRPSLWGGLVKVVVVGSPESVIGLHVCSVYFIDTLNPKPISLSQAAMIKKVWNILVWGGKQTQTAATEITYPPFWNVKQLWHQTAYI